MAAVVAFLQAFVRYAQGKRTFLNELHEAFDKNPDLKSRSRECIDQAMELVIGRGQLAGVVRTDVDGSDVMQLVGPMCTNATLLEDQSARLLTMILDAAATAGLVRLHRAADRARRHSSSSTGPRTDSLSGRVTPFRARSGS